MTAAAEDGVRARGGRRAGPAWTVVRTVAANRQLRRVELAFVTFNCGELASWLAMLVYAYAQGGVTESGLVATAMLVPSAALAPVLAGLGERGAPGNALAAGYAVQAASSAAVAAALLAHATPPLVYALIAAQSVTFVTTRPTQSAFAPGLARTPDELTATNVVSGWIESASMLAAPALAGAVLAAGSPALVFALSAAGCGLGALLVLPLRRAVPARPVADGADVDALGGSIAFVRRDPNARMLLVLLGAQFVAIGALDVLVVDLARAELHRGGDWAGYLSAAFGAGGVLAVLATARLVGLRRLAGPLVVSLAIWAAAFAALAGAPGATAALLLLAVAGAGRAAFDVTGRTLLQRTSRPDLLARVFGLLEGLQMAGLAAGALLAPAFVALGGARLAFACVGGVLPLVALATGRRLIDIDRHATVPIVEVTLLRSLPIFAPLPPPTLEALARALEPLNVSAGTEVVRQGDEGDRFYVIADGEADVSADGRHLAALGRGDGFGEIALVYGVPRTATVRTRSDSSLYALDRESFLVAITGHAPAKTLAERLATDRLEELRAHREAHPAEATPGGR